MGVWKSLWWREKLKPWFRPRKAQPLKLEAKASKVADDALKSPLLMGKDDKIFGMI